MSRNANYSTIVLSSGALFQVENTPGEVEDLVNSSRFIKRGRGEKRDHRVTELVELRLIPAHSGRSDADYRKTVFVDPNLVAAIFPLDERPSPQRVVQVDRVEADLGMA